MFLRTLSVLLICAAALVLFGACNQPTAGTANPGKFIKQPAKESPGQVLAKDVISSGFVPGMPLPEGFKTELSQRSPKGFEGMDSYKAGNAVIFLNAKDETLHTAIITNSQAANSAGLSNVELKTSDGRGFFQLSAEDVVKAFGEPALKMPTTKGAESEMGYYYSYTKGPAIIHVIFSFKQAGEKLGPMDSIVLDMITAEKDIQAYKEKGKPFAWPEK